MDHPLTCRQRSLRIGLALAAGLALGCGDYGGGSGITGGDVVLPSQSGTSGASESEMIAAFQTTVWEPYIVEYCADCHAGSGPGSPHIAHPDVATAYSATMDNQKVNLAAPEQSRLVRRLVTDFHHCWADCVTDGAEMQAAISAWAQMVAFDAGAEDVEGLASQPTTLAAGVEDKGDERYLGNLIALFEFKEGGGSRTYDSSGVEPLMTLRLDGPTLMSSYGINIEQGYGFATRDESEKLFRRIADPETGSQQYTIEAWVTPENIEQEGPARIISYSNGTQSRNFTVGQVQYQYDFRNRNVDPEVNDNGLPSLQTYDADQDAQPTLQHLVMTYDQYRGRRVYVDGVFTDDVDPSNATRLWNWAPRMQLVVGNEIGGDRQWEGQLRLLAIYEVALTEAQIRQNFQAGVGRRLLLSFDVSQWVGGSGAVEFLVTELDDYSYLFCEPSFKTANPGNFRVSNLRIGVNGTIPVAGQAFTHVDTLVSEDGQQLSRQCSVIAKGPGGAGSDSFSLHFEYLGQFEEPVVVEFPPPPPPGSFGDPLPLEGLRDFARVNASMAAATGVDPSLPGPRDTFQELTQQLPPTPDLRTFNSAQQVAIAKLGLEYCDQLIEDDGLRSSFFPGLDFTLGPGAALADRSLLFEPLVSKLLGDNVANQPSLAEVTPILDALVDDLTDECSMVLCGADKTEAVVKGVCAAVIGSAGMTIH